MRIEQSIYSINTAAAAITHFPAVFIPISCLRFARQRVTFIYLFFTCVTVGALPDGKNGRQLLSAHWLQLQQPFPLLMGWGLTVFQHLQFGRGGVVAKQTVEQPRASVNFAVVLLQELNKRGENGSEKWLEALYTLANVIIIKQF